jgi:hypothetical protein
MTDVKSKTIYRTSFPHRLFDTWIRNQKPSWAFPIDGGGPCPYTNAIETGTKASDITLNPFLQHPKEEKGMERIVRDLAQISAWAYYTSKSEIVGLFMKNDDWRKEPPEEIEYLARSVMRVINAVRYFRNRFPVGIIPHRVARKMEGTPFDPETLETAARIFYNREGPDNVLAFPRLYNRPSLHVQRKKVRQRSRRREKERTSA